MGVELTPFPTSSAVCVPASIIRIKG